MYDIERFVSMLQSIYNISYQSTDNEVTGRNERKKDFKQGVRALLYCIRLVNHRIAGYCQFKSIYTIMIHVRKECFVFNMLQQFLSSNGAAEIKKDNS